MSIYGNKLAEFLVTVYIESYVKIFCVLTAKTNRYKKCWATWKLNPVQKSKISWDITFHASVVGPYKNLSPCWTSTFSLFSDCYLCKICFHTCQKHGSIQTALPRSCLPDLLSSVVPSSPRTPQSQWCHCLMQHNSLYFKITWKAMTRLHLPNWSFFFLSVSKALTNIWFLR